MKKRLIKYLIIACLFSSCTDSEKTIFLKADNVNGLVHKNAVTLNGIKVGSVQDVSLNSKGRPIVELSLVDTLQIPNDSKFIIDCDLLGDRSVTIELGIENKIIALGDTLIANLRESSIDSETVKEGIGELLESFTGAKRKDSILNELRRLNENLEELKKN